MANDSKAYGAYAQQREIANSPEAEVANLEAELGIGQPQVQDQALGAQAPKPQAQSVAPQSSGGINQQAKELGLKKEPMDGPEGALFNKANDPAKLAKLKIGSVGDAMSYHGSEALAAQGLGGMADTVQELGNAAIDVADWMEGYAQKWGLTSQDFVDPKNRMTWATKMFPKSDDPVQQATRSVFKFLAPMGAAGLASKANKIRAVATGTAISAGVDFAAFDPQETRLSNLIQEYPDLRNPVAAYLASDPNDSNMEGRFKNMVEGLLVDGSMTAALTSAMKGYKVMRGVKNSVTSAVSASADMAEGAAKRLEQETAAAAKVGENVPPAKVGEVVDPAVAEGMNVKPKDVNGNGASEGAGGVPAATTTPEPKTTPKATQMPFFQMDAEKITAARTPKELEKAVTLNLENLTSSDEIRKVIKNFAEATRGSQAAARRVTDKEVKDLATGASKLEPGSMPIKETQELARQMAMEPEELLGRWKVGTAFNAEEIDAARILLNSAANDVAAKAKAAINGDDAAKLAFSDALQGYGHVHTVLQGVTTEAGRSLRILRELSQEGAVDQARAIKEAISLSGGAQALDEQAQMVLDMLNRGGGSGEMAQRLSKIVQRSKGQTIRDGMYEVWINGLLSSPKTLVVNAVANTLVAGNAVLERAVARGISKTRQALGGTGGVAEGEVKAMFDVAASEPAIKVLASVQGFMDSILAAGKSLRPSQMVDDFVAWERRPGTDMFTKLEGDFEPVITSKTAKEFGTYRLLQEQLPGLADHMDRATDVLGSAIRLPGRGLQATDQFFKTVAYRSEINARAWREAAEQGLTGESAAKFVADFVNDPPPYMQSSAIGFAREQTFTTPLKGWQDSFQKFVQQFGKDSVLGVAPLKAVIPFARTGFNLLNYSFDHSPLGLLGSRFHADYAAGGARRDMALARISVGSTFMGTAALLASQGAITGNGPANLDAKKIWKAAGNQENSIKIGDKWVSYDRLDPFGSMLGLAADAAEIAGLITDENDGDFMRIVTLAAATAGDAMTPEFISGNFADLLEAMNEPEGRKAQTFITNLVATGVPYSSALREVRKAFDPAKRETKPDPKLKGIHAQLDEMMNKFKSMMPGLSETLPPQRNIFGEVVHYPSGLGPDIVSPFAFTEQTKSPGVKELVRLGIAGPVLNPTPKEGETNLQIKMPSKLLSVSVAGQSQSFKMTPQQYDRYVQLSAGHDLKRGVFGGKTLVETLDEQVKENWPALGRLKNDQNKRLLVKTIIERYREAAKAQLKAEDPTIGQRIRELQEQALNARTQEQ